MLRVASRHEGEAAVSRRFRRAVSIIARRRKPPPYRGIASRAEKVKY